MADLKAVVSGSFRRHLAEIRLALRELAALGVEILSPEDADAVGTRGSFVILESDGHDDIRRLEDAHLDAIADCDFLWVVVPDGTAGQSTCLEIGYALAMGKPIYTQAQLVDTTLTEYAIQVPDARAVISLHGKGE